MNLEKREIKSRLRGNSEALHQWVMNMNSEVMRQLKINLNLERLPRLVSKKKKRYQPHTRLMKKQSIMSWDPWMKHGITFQERLRCRQTNQLLLKRLTNGELAASQPEQFMLGVSQIPSMVHLRDLNLKQVHLLWRGLVNHTLCSNIQEWEIPPVKNFS